MTREGALLVMIGVAVLLLALGVVAWRRRMRRDAGLTAPVGAIPAGATTTGSADGFYVATTRHGEPLERLAIRHLGFRSRVAVTVTDAGVALDLPGAPDLFVPRERIDDVALANVAIDRVVEPGGLVRLTWRADASGEASGDAVRGAAAAQVAVDSYLRPQDGSARALADQIAAMLPASSSSSDRTPTGADS